MEIAFKKEKRRTRNKKKYLGVNLDVRLKWKQHLKKKKDELEIRRSIWG
jgi:hypothetical protein